MAAARRKARHRKADAAIVATVLSDPRASQERAIHDVRRQAIVGDGADPVHASSPLGVMYARKVHGVGGVEFGDEHLLAAQWFKRLYLYRNGRCTPKGTLDIGVRSDDGPQEKPERDAQFRALMSDRRMRKANVLVCPLVFEAFPRWLEAIVAADGEGSIGRDQAEFMAVADNLRAIWLEMAAMSAELLRARR